MKRVRPKLNARKAVRNSFALSYFVLEKAEGQTEKSIYGWGRGYHDAFAALYFSVEGEG